MNPCKKNGHDGHPPVDPGRNPLSRAALAGLMLAATLSTAQASVTLNSTFYREVRAGVDLTEDPAGSVEFLEANGDTGSANLTATGYTDPLAALHLVTATSQQNANLNNDDGQINLLITNYVLDLTRTENSKRPGDWQTPSIGIAGNASAIPSLSATYNLIQFTFTVENEVENFNFGFQGLGYQEQSANLGTIELFVRLFGDHGVDITSAYDPVSLPGSSDFPDDAQPFQLAISAQLAPGTYTFIMLGQGTGKESEANQTPIHIEGSGSLALGGAVPEPTAAALSLLGATALLRRRRN